MNTALDAVVAALAQAALGNAHTALPPAAVLWPDKERQWASAIPQLKEALPSLFELGDYEPELRRGPAIWLKCAISGLLTRFPYEGVPVLYLPGVSRSELRAIESCPRDLQPLAELAYRGQFWSQANAKDWTLSAFLGSPNGGLGLEVGQDRATVEALGLALQSGKLLKQGVAALKGRVINAEWLTALVAPNPNRDMLAWLNDPQGMLHAWAGPSWQVFCNLAKSDYGLDPVQDGPLAAAELLAKGEGRWAAVAEQYADAHASFPNVLEQLRKVPLPVVGLFTSFAQLAAYPRFNDDEEVALRQELLACGDQDASAARSRVVALEAKHAERRSWLWAKMGLAPLAQALGHLARVAEWSQALPTGQDPVALAASHAERGWQVDDAALMALGVVQQQGDRQAVGAALRSLYLPWLEESAKRFQQAVAAAGALPHAAQAPLPPWSEGGSCTLFVDGLRLDLAHRLQAKLQALGETRLDTRWTSLPSVTASGKAWCSPVAKWVAGSQEDLEFVPRVAADGKPLSAHHFRKLLADQGIQYLDRQATGDTTGQAWTEMGDVDHHGHEHGLHMAQDLDRLLDEVVERLQGLSEAGWRRFRIVTDHGWLLLPGGLPKSDLPKHQTETRWGRCAVLKEQAHGTALTFGWDWCQAVQVAYAPGVSNFVAGAEYAHGGISLQECLVPVLEWQPRHQAAGPNPIRILAVAWRGLRCKVTVEGGAAGLTVDLRTKAAAAASSLADKAKPLVDGQASLVVPDDEAMGTQAVLVVLGPDGEVLQKQATTVGEH